MINAATEFLAMLFMLLLLFGTKYETTGEGLQWKLYICLLWSCVAALASDAIAWWAAGIEAVSGLLYITNIISLIMGELLIIIFGYYILAIYNEKEETSYRPAHIVAIINGASIIAILTACIFGKLFELRDGVFRLGPFYPFLVIPAALSMLMGFWFILKKRDLTGPHDTIALLAYILIPAVGTILEMFIFTNVACIYNSAALSLTVIFIMIQSKAINQAKLRETTLNQISREDTLTGLQNRLAFEEFLNKNPKGDGVHVIFCDVNGLKYMNDNFGHKAGDELIKSFADLLKGIFKHEETFRISGDEFVVMTMDTNTMFQTRATLLKDSVKLHHHIASVGVDFEAQGSMNEKISAAENAMYAEKTIYYQTVGKDRDRRR